MTTLTRSTAPVDPVGVDLTRTLRALKLGGMTDTLPERLHLARQQQLGHAAFLELVLSDEVTRREGRSAALRAAKAGLDPGMRLDIDHDRYETRPALADLWTVWSGPFRHLGGIDLDGILQTLKKIGWAQDVLSLELFRPEYYAMSADDVYRIGKTKSDAVIARNF